MQFKPMNIKIPSEIHKELKTMAFLTETTMKEIIIRCIKRELGDYKNSQKTNKEQL